MSISLAVALTASLFGIIIHHVPAMFLSQTEEARVLLLGEVPNWLLVWGLIGIACWLVAIGAGLTFLWGLV